MQRALWLALVALGFLVIGLGPKGAGAQDKDKAVVVEMNGLKSQVPADWKSEKPANLLRWMQFKIPKAEGDPADAELILSKGLGGSAEQNVQRWKGQFIAPEGKTIDDVSKVSQKKVANMESTYFEVEGTYKEKEKPIDPDSKAKLRPHYKMLALQLDSKDETYHIKLIGPAKTIDGHQKDFEKWLENFK